MPLGSQEHSIADCPQAATLQHHTDTMGHHGEILDRLERHSERQTLALEQIAEQGAIVKTHEKRIDRHDVMFDEIFRKARGCASDIDTVSHRVSVIELTHATEAGESRAEIDGSKFWDNVKIQLVPCVLVTILYLLWLIDKFGVIENIVKYFREMKG
jgi:hypothetical protein